MININGNLLLESEAEISTENRGLHYGDAAFETLRYDHGKILFWEDHYFRLMATMRILRMEIPMSFTPEYLEEQLLRSVRANKLEGRPARLKILVSRKPGGYYHPLSKDIDFLIVASELSDSGYLLNKNEYVVDLFKDYYIAPGLLSTLKTTNKLVNVLGSIYADEQGLDNCLLMNTNKMVVEGLNGNLFLVFGNKVKTPPLSDGCLKGIMRSQLIEIISKLEGFELVEETVSPFELQKADEMFLTNVISGIIPVGRYKRKEFKKEFVDILNTELNRKITA